MSKGHTCLALSLFLLVGLPNAAWAIDDEDPPPVSATESIDVTVGPTNPFDAVYPNVFDLKHPKLLHLQGIARVSNPEPGSTLFVQFDWFDEMGGQHFSDVFSPFIVLNQPQSIDLSWTIPFCPPEVSLHLSTQGPGSITFIGDFTHTCLVPEPSSLLLAGCGAAGLGLVVRKRRRPRG
ncbi:MAG: PEP-CTERM sorting domain-containing protein [Pirellulales bacterium]|nr:PEP-CTERM sorting domain-containing protein [Pirellulales bacterium]